MQKQSSSSVIFSPPPARCRVNIITGRTQTGTGVQNGGKMIDALLFRRETEREEDARALVGIIIWDAGPAAPEKVMGKGRFSGNLLIRC